MKLQHIAIIFVIIIVPISLVLSNYISMHMKTIELQATYNANLINATHDSMKAFQLNTQNNDLSDIANSKIRDIEAAINVFYTSLSTNLEVKGYTKEDLKSYTPAILFTLYDGYYIYSNNYNYNPQDTDPDSQGYKYGLKPFIAYSCRYKIDQGEKYDFVVNYTLDNTITIIGKVDGAYVTKTGHLISLEDAKDIEDNGNILKYVNGEETLEEQIIILDDNSNAQKDTYEYVIYGNQKIYKEKDSNGENDKKYFKYSSQYKKDYITSATTIKELDEKYNKTESAEKYYKEAASFTKWVNEKLKDIKQSHAVNESGAKITTFQSDLEDEKIFDTSNENNPMLSSSIFNEQRVNVIRYTIETNLVRAMNTYSQHSSLAGIAFSMPKLTEQDWENIENNICEVVFMQGLPIGGKLYNNYCVVTNNTNKECVNNNSIYIISKDKNSGNKEYHQPGCRTLITGLNNENLELAGAYSAIDFKRRTVALTGEDVNALSQLLSSYGVGADDGKFAYYYPQPYEACYDCIVTASDAYTTDDIIYGQVIDQFGRTTDDYGDPYGNIKNRDGNDVDITNLNGTNLQKYYLTALARARYDLYLVNGYFGNY